MSSTRCWFEKSGINVRKIVNLEDFASWISTVFGKTAIHSDTMSLKVLTEQKLATTAVEAFVAKLRVAGKWLVAT
jgi:hypothetical protein